MTTQSLIFASGNVGKLDEINPYFKDLGIKLTLQSEYSVNPIQETGLSFVENAILKARHAAKETGLPCFADDSGLVVDSLDGTPGIYSARYAGEGESDIANIEKLLLAMQDIPQEKRSASFHCTIAYFRYANDPDPYIAQGIWHGKILESPQGSQGFGYDPIFYVPSHQCSAAELIPETKQCISHRGQAMQMLINWLSSNLPPHLHCNNT